MAIGYVGATNASMATVATQTMTLPAGWAHNDFGVLVAESNNSGAPAITTPPTGWTLRAGPTTDGSGSDARAWCWTRLLQSGDADPVIDPDTTATIQGVASLVVYTGVDTTTPLAGSVAAGGTAVATTHTSTAVTTTGAATIVVFLTADGTTAVSGDWTGVPAGFTERVDFAGAAAAIIFAGEKAEVSAVTSQTYANFTKTESDSCVCFVIPLNPAAGAVTTPPSLVMAPRVPS